MQGIKFPSLGWEDPLEKEMARILKWVAISFSKSVVKKAEKIEFYYTFGEGNGNPLQYSCLENCMNRGVWQATVHGVAESQT